MLLRLILIVGALVAIGAIALYLTPHFPGGAIESQSQAIAAAKWAIPKCAFEATPPGPWSARLNGHIWELVSHCPKRMCWMEYELDARSGKLLACREGVVD